jgi:hypothetical protein
MFWHDTFQGCEDFICKPKDFVLHILLVPSGTIHFKQIYDCENHTNNNKIQNDDNQHHITTEVTGRKMSSNYEPQIFITNNIPTMTHFIVAHLNQDTFYFTLPHMT